VANQLIISLIAKKIDEFLLSIIKVFKSHPNKVEKKIKRVFYYLKYSCIWKNTSKNIWIATNIVKKLISN